MRRISIKLAVLVSVLGILGVLAEERAYSAAACVGTIGSIYVETDDVLNFTIIPSDSNSCGCNNTWDGGKGFFNPPSYANHNKTYTTALGAKLAGKVVQVWYDWSDANGTQRCIAYNVMIK